MLAGLEEVAFHWDSANKHFVCEALDVSGIDDLLEKQEAEEKAQKVRLFFASYIQLINSMMEKIFKSIKQVKIVLCDINICQTICSYLFSFCHLLVDLLFP